MTHVHRMESFYLYHCVETLNLLDKIHWQRLGYLRMSML